MPVQCKFAVDIAPETMLVEGTIQFRERGWGAPYWLAKIVKRRPMTIIGVIGKTESRY